MIISLPESPAGRAEQGPGLITGLITQQGLFLAVALALPTESTKPLGRGTTMDVPFTAGFSFISLFYTQPSYSSKKKTVLKLLQKSDQMLTWSGFSLISIYSEKKLKF